jgi:hypothetical protein
VERILREVSDDRVRVYVIWDPIFGGKFDQESQNLANRSPDKRVTYFKDPNSLSGQLWKGVLDIEREIAWDVYMLYSASAEWKTEPPQPDYWMHQLWGVTKAPHFDEAKFKARLKEMVNQTETQGVSPGENNKMKVEFLYFNSCPSHKQALANLRAALRQTRTKAELILIDVDSPEKAEKVGFQGSPSIRINGEDLEGRNEAANYSCRLYNVKGRAAFAPSKEAIVAKLESLMK